MEKENYYLAVTELAEIINKKDLDAIAINQMFIDMGYIKREKDYHGYNYYLEEKGKKYGRQIEPDNINHPNYYVIYDRAVLNDPDVIDYIKSYFH